MKMSVLFGLIAFVGMAAAQSVAWTCNNDGTGLFQQEVLSADYPADGRKCSSHRNGSEEYVAYESINRTNVCAGYYQCTQNCSTANVINAFGWEQCAKAYADLNVSLAVTQRNLDACNKRADHEEAEEKECRKQNREIKENVAKLLKLLKKKECGLDFCRANELACDESSYH